MKLLISDSEKQIFAKSQHSNRIVFKVHDTPACYLCYELLVTCVPLVTKFTLVAE